MTGFGIAAAFVLLGWCALLYVPFRWRPVGICLVIEKWLAIGYVPFIAIAGAALGIAGGVFGAWWVAVPAGLHEGLWGFLLKDMPGGRTRLSSAATRPSAPDGRTVRLLLVVHPGCLDHAGTHIGGAQAEYRTSGPCRNGHGPPAGEGHGGGQEADCPEPVGRVSAHT
ncbi:MAG TPA: hypothetical protein VFA45_13855 [Actinomycetes bacterium]|nr:hypothetical protein [Actinomycetes bacterium]